jgi:putative glycosyltransferase (TIGR04348 family)
MTGRILITNPEHRSGSSGNTTTAGRWARFLRKLGYEVQLAEAWDSLSRPDLLIALHARRSAGSVRDLRTRLPEVPVVVVCTGTDLYRDLPDNQPARRSLELADRVVVLHSLATRSLPDVIRAKTTVIHQSAVMPRVPKSRAPRAFRVAVLANLRSLKDPLRAALAARELPAHSRIQILHAGRGLEKPLIVRARRESERNPRYQWLGDLPGWRARRLLAGSRLLVLSSRMEGGANVVSEAIIAGVPVLGSEIPGNEGLLGRGYPGLFPVGDTAALAALMERAETDEKFYRRLRDRIAGRKSLFSPQQERKALNKLVKNLL